MIITLCFCGLLTIAQKTATSEEKKIYVSNFVVAQEKLIWRKVFDGSVSIKDYEKFLKLGANLDNIEVSENDSLIIGRLRRKRLDFTGFKDGLLITDVPVYLNQNDVVADVKIEVKENKYRVTVSEIKLVAQKSSVLWQQNEVDNLDLYYFKLFSKKKYVSETFITYSEPIFDKNFIDKFQYKVVKSDF